MFDYETIISECKRVGNSLPKIKRDSSSIMVECNPSNKFLKSLKELKEKTVIFNYDRSGTNDTIYGTNGTVNDTNGTVNDTNGTVNDTNGTVKLTDVESQILEIIKENSNVTYNQILEELGLARRTIARFISSLKKNGYIERVGSDKSGYYKINKRKRYEK